MDENPPQIMPQMAPQMTKAAKKSAPAPKALWAINPAAPLLIVGLGNPGSGYAYHRHNIGFRLLEALRTDVSFPGWSVKFQGLTTTGMLGRTKLILLQPQTFMNLSGTSVQGAAQFYKVPPENILVIHDDIDLAPGKIRFKQGGGHGGHNGLRSIDSHLGKNYWRLRIGVGHPGHSDQVAGYVLHDFPKEEEKTWIFSLLAHFPTLFPTLLNNDTPGGGDFLSRINRLLHPTPSHPLQKKDLNHGL